MPDNQPCLVRRFVNNCVGQSRKPAPRLAACGFQNKLRGGGRKKAKDAKKVENALLVKLTNVLEQFGKKSTQQ